jgi:hypothetical protein
MAIAMPHRWVQPPIKGGPPERKIEASAAEIKLLKALGGAGIPGKDGTPSYENLYGLATPAQTESYYSAPQSQTESYYSAPQSSVGAYTTGSGGGYGVGGGGGTMPASSPSYSSRNSGASENAAVGSMSPAWRDTSYTGGGNYWIPNGGANYGKTQPMPNDVGGGNYFSPRTQIQILNDISSTLGHRNQGGNGMMGFGNSPIGSATIDRQQASQIRPVNFQISQAPDPNRMTADMVGNVPYFNGPHPQPVGFASQASPADLAASYAAFGAQPSQTQTQPKPPAGASSWLGDNTQAQPVAQNVGTERNYGSFAPQDMAAGLDADHKGVYGLAARYPNMTATDIMRMASLESAQTMNPAVMGGKGGNYRGVFQFGPEEQKQFGLDPKTNPNPTIGQEATALGDYFDQRGLNRNASLGDAYTVINHGSGTLADNAWRNDNNGTGTIGDKVAELQNPTSRFSKQANAWLGNNQPPAAQPAPTQMAMNAPPSTLGGSPTSLSNPTLQQPFNWPSLENGSQTQIASAGDQTQPPPISNADTVVPPAGANAPSSTLDKLLGAASPRLGPHQTTDVPLQIANSLPGVLGPIAKFLGTPRGAPTGGPLTTANNEGFGTGRGGNAQLPIASTPAPAQPNPQQIQDLVAQLQTTTDPVKHAQILAMLRELDPNTIRYGLQMRQNA